MSKRTQYFKVRNLRGNKLNKNRNMNTTAFMIMISVMLSRLLGFFRTALIPIKFGGELGPVSDAYIAAFQIPDLMYSLIVGGAIAASLIPILSGYVDKGEEKKGWRAISSFINLMMIIMAIISILGIVFAPQLMGIIAKGFADSQETMDLTINLTRTLMPIAFFMMISGLCNGILNSYNKFAVAAFGPCFYNLACVLSIALLSNSNEADNYGVRNVVIGIVFCAVSYAIFQFIFTYKHLKNYKPEIHVADDDFKIMVKLAVPSLLTSTLMQLNLIVSKSYATFYDEGSLSALELANKTWQMPLGIIAQAIGVAMLPSLSALFMQKKFNEYEKKLNTALNLVMFLGIPSAVAMALLSESIIRVLFNTSGTLSQGEIKMTASILTFYCIALVTQCYNTIMNRAYYSTKNSSIPFIGGALGICLNFVLAYNITMHTNIGPKGIALAYSVSTIVNTIVLATMFKKRVSNYKVLKGFNSLWKTLISTGIMALIIVIFDQNILPYFFQSSIINLPLLKAFLWLIIDIVLGGSIYLFTGYLLKINEVVNNLELIKNKLKRK